MPFECDGVNVGAVGEMRLLPQRSLMTRFRPSFRLMVSRKDLRGSRMLSGTFRDSFPISDYTQIHSFS